MGQILSYMKTKFVFAVVVLMHARLFAGDSQDLVAHEWGTFTSVQGADGIQLEWNPLVTTELPKFVYDCGRPNGNSRAARFADYSGKGAFVTLQRMETPVIYFYSGREQDVDVSVKFPQGFVTEWFPQVAKYESHQMRWDRLHLLPREQNAALTKALPVDASGSHYFAARETDSDFILAKNDSGQKQISEHEKFLFYRGVGNFRAPLQVTLAGDEDTVVMKNMGAEPLSHLFILSVRHGKGKYLYVEQLPAGREQSVKLQLQRGQSDLSDVRARLGQEMAAGLVREGLFDREAAAMVKTWNDSWFGEEGLRVLYTLPRPWTDRILPLTISPMPSAVVRVIVGRAELITPTMEWALMKQVAQYSQDSSQAKEQAIAGTRATGLGRFTEPTIRRLVGKMPSREFSQTAWNFLEAVGKPADRKLALAK